MAKYINDLQLNLKTKSFNDVRDECSKLFKEQDAIRTNYLNIKQLPSVINDPDYKYDIFTIKKICTLFEQSIYVFYKFYYQYVHAHSFDCVLFIEDVAVFDFVGPPQMYPCNYDLEKVFYMKLLRDSLNL